MNLFIDVLMDAAIDSVRMLPFYLRHFAAGGDGKACGEF